MTTTAALIDAIKAELKAAHITYAELAEKLGMAESSIKRMLAKRDMALSKIDSICTVLKIDFADLARRVSESQVLLAELTLAQEKTVVSDKKMLLVAICVLSQWSAEQITAHYKFTDMEVIKYLTLLDRIGIIELRTLNRYSLKLAKTFRWRPHGPVMNFFRENALLDYFKGGFDGESESLLLVHGTISKSMAPSFVERIQRVAQDFAQQHQTDQKLAKQHTKGYSLLLSMRSWDYEVFEQYRR
ncbi:helix-turn-helix domain-containing protein [Sapientia aquatica]|uniref:XRE family transcriptional regulator n=1 Tax=Sapientia aquatica TaxID=1549640 RepID=A0A4R5VRB0_9BURK|nr:helix-turn-helix transcriptional regulator [Sapientia aquatica]TDK61190.1 XRE family transcriptional regulator [Sapientia aquatica]